MKICILGNAQSPHIKRWARFFRGRGHKVSIISARPDEMDGVEVYVPKLPFDSLLRRSKTFDEDRSPHLAIYLSYVAIALRIRSLMRRIGPDILMAMTMETNGIISMIAGHHPTALFHLGPKALSLRSETSLLMRWLVKRMIRYCDMLYTGDSAGAARLQELGAHGDKIHVNPWGTDLDPADSKAEVEELRAPLDAPRKKLFVVSTTRTASAAIFDTSVTLFAISRMLWLISSMAATTPLICCVSSSLVNATSLISSVCRVLLLAISVESDAIWVAAEFTSKVAS